MANNILRKETNAAQAFLWAGRALTLLETRTAADTITMSGPEIALKDGVSISAIKQRRNQIINKTGSQNIREAIHKLTKAGFLTASFLIPALLAQTLLISDDDASQMARCRGRSRQVRRVKNGRKNQGIDLDIFDLIELDQKSMEA
jgi:hypothetical protein